MRAAASLVHRRLQLLDRLVVLRLNQRGVVLHLDAGVLGRVRPRVQRPRRPGGVVRLQSAASRAGRRLLLRRGDLVLQLWARTDGVSARATRKTEQGAGTESRGRSARQNRQSRGGAPAASGRRLASPGRAWRQWGRVPAPAASGCAGRGFRDRRKVAKCPRPPRAKVPGPQAPSRRWIRLRATPPVAWMGRRGRRARAAARGGVQHPRAARSWARVVHARPKRRCLPARSAATAQRGAWPRVRAGLAPAGSAATPGCSW